MTALTHVDVLIQPGLYEVQSLESATRYYVDTRLGRPPQYLRAAAGDNTFTGRLDDLWHPLAQIVSGPVTWNGERYLEPAEIDPKDNAAWTLRVGSSHVYVTPEPNPDRGRPYYWVRSSACKAITALDDLPDDMILRLARTITRDLS